MESFSRKIYDFGGFQLDVAERRLFDGEKNIQLPPKILDTLILLVANAGKILSKERMLEEIWEDSFVEENNLAQNISHLRRIFGESKDVKFIETVPKFGYRFVAAVKSPEDPSKIEVFEALRTRVAIREINEEISEVGTFRTIESISEPRSLSFHLPETHYVQNGDVNIAYQVVGEGEIDIVFVMGWVSHLEYFWKHHLFASFLNRLASFSRLILFDKRGTGLSDRVPLSELPTLEQRMEDVHAVMDEVDSERAVLIGVSEGGPMCSLFAATYPERTSGLVMIGTYAKRIKEDDYPWGVSAEDREGFFEQMKRDWGQPVGIEERAPSMADDEEFRNWWAEYLRMGASPGAAVALTKMNAEIDVRNVLPTVRVPTLVIHRTGDMCLKVEEGRYVSELIPGSRFVEFGGIDHLPFVGDQQQILDEIEGFMAELREVQEIDRVLATVMCIKIVNPQAEEKERGALDWQKLLDRSNLYVQNQLKFYKGKEVSINSNGILATFDGPARAIRCASAITSSAVRLKIGVKAGLHTGECDVVDGKYGGFAVELAQNIAEESKVGEILASRTVKDLVAGSGIAFEERGKKTFSENAGEWRLFSIR